MRYVRFVADLAQGELGTSVLTKKPVIESVMTALPLTLQLTFLGLAVAVVLALAFGVTAALFRDRWPVEQVPLAGKQMLGGARQFVSAPESCQRLPELNLSSGAIVTYLAATLPAAPTGFWDRNPKPTSGRLRRLLARVHFPESYPLPERLRKKASVSDHLPKGIEGHRRTKQALVT